MAFNSYKLIVRVWRSDGTSYDVKCETLEQARVVLATSKSAEIVGNYE